MVFVDPPFRKGLLEETLNLLETNGWLANNASIYVESEVKMARRRSPPVGICIGKKLPVRWHIASIIVMCREKKMLINLGRFC